MTLAHPDCPASVHHERGAIPCVCAALRRSRSDGYAAGKRFVALSLRYHVDWYGAEFVADVIGGEPPPDPDLTAVAGQIAARLVDEEKSG